MAEAGAQYEPALRINPQLSVTHNHLGVLLFRLGDAFGAVCEYQLVIAGRPGYDEAHYNLAVALASRGSMEEAEKSLEGAIRYAPDYFEAHLKLGQILAARGPLSARYRTCGRRRKAPIPRCEKQRWMP